MYCLRRRATEHGATNYGALVMATDHVVLNPEEPTLEDMTLQRH